LNKLIIHKYKKILKEHLTYNDAVSLIKKYIKITKNEDAQINEYVPNVHIAMIFREVLIFLELENMYPTEFHNIPYKFLPKISEYFKNNITIVQIHNTYQMLRRKEDYLRNGMKYANIELHHVIQHHINNKDLNAHKIKLKY